MDIVQLWVWMRPKVSCTLDGSTMDNLDKMWWQGLLGIMLHGGLFFNSVKFAYSPRTKKNCTRLRRSPHPFACSMEFQVLFAKKNRHMFQLCEKDRPNFQPAVRKKTVTIFSPTKKKPVTIVSPTKIKPSQFSALRKRTRHNFQPCEKNRSHLGQGHARPKCDWFSGKPVAISNAKCKH